MTFVELVDQHFVYYVYAPSELFATIPDHMHPSSAYESIAYLLLNKSHVYHDTGQPVGWPDIHDFEVDLM